MTIIFTAVLTLTCFYFLLNNTFTIGFGAWSTLNIAYENKHYPEQQIREQQYDAVALGYGAKRVVEVKPFAGIFWKVKPVDTTKMDKLDWIRADKEGDVKFPKPIYQQGTCDGIDIIYSGTKRVIVNIISLYKHDISLLI